MPYFDAIFLQNVAHKEGFTTKMTKGFIYFGEFEREIDAKAVAEQLKNRFDISVKINRNAALNANIITFPRLWNDFYAHIIKSWRSQGYAVKVEVIEEKNIAKPKSVATLNKKPSPKPAAPKKFFSLKYDKAMSYKAQNDSTSSKEFKEGELSLKNEFEYGKTITTKEGEVFIKVKDKNLYFSDRDVVMR